jgi:hypothetical protein
MSTPNGYAQTLYSKTFEAAPHVCDGKDHVAALLLPWEDVPITIRAVAISHEIDRLSPSGWHGWRAPPVPQGYAFVGSSNPADGDLLTPKVIGENGYAYVAFPRSTGFRFPAKGGANPPHIDIHLSCHGGANDQATAVIFYTRDSEAALSSAVR